MKKLRLPAVLLLAVLVCLLIGLRVRGGESAETEPTAPPVVTHPAVTILPKFLQVTPTPKPTPTPEPTPDMSELPPEWFDDALFFGDSVTVALERYCDKTAALGDALFLCEFCYSVRNAVAGSVDIWYQGSPYRPEDVVPLTDANKIFIMLGINDVALSGGIEHTIECWEIMLNSILEQSPDVTFFIESSLPMHYAGQLTGLNNKKLDEYNERLKEYCEEKGYVFVDIAHYFKDDRNGMKNEYSEDQYVHVTPEAAELWVSLLRDPANYSVNPRSIEYGKKN